MMKLSYNYNATPKRNGNFGEIVYICIQKRSVTT